MNAIRSVLLSHSVTPRLVVWGLACGIIVSVTMVGIAQVPEAPLYAPSVGSVEPPNVNSAYSPNVIDPVGSSVVHSNGSTDDLQQAGFFRFGSGRAARNRELEVLEGEPLSDEELHRLGTSKPLEFELSPDAIPSLQIGHPYRVYRSEESVISYLPGDGDSFGMFDLESNTYLPRNEKSGVDFAINIHWLAGPNVVPLPARLYDFIMGYQRRGDIGPVFSYDVATTLGVYSDFEDSARQGVRYPAHAVGMIHRDPNTDYVFGVDYLSRDDVKILPVVGFSKRLDSLPGWRFDVIFPRPKVSCQVTNRTQVYFNGQLGGGTWDIEFPNDANDVVTYRDFRLMFGCESIDDGFGIHAIEMGLLLGRNISFRTLPDQFGLDDAFIIRFVTRR